jgi:hypothetical protein
MCNLYSITKGQKAIRDLAKAMIDHAGNMPTLPGVFPNRMAPVVRVAPKGRRELLMMRWGFPPPFIPGNKPRNPYLTNVRKTDSRYWQTISRNRSIAAWCPSPALPSLTIALADGYIHHDDMDLRASGACKGRHIDNEHCRRLA